MTKNSFGMDGLYLKDFLISSFFSKDDKIFFTDVGDVKRRVSSGGGVS